MRLAQLLFLLLLPASTALVACGGAVAPPPDGQSSGSSRTATSDPPPSTSGSTSGSANGTAGAKPTCTSGASVFCRCADRSEGTRQCDDSGRTFDECICGPGALPPPDCVYPPSTNPPPCPAVYSHAYQGQPCDTPNLQCSYPGAGDGDAKGCASTAGLMCRVTPGGAASWVAVQ